MSSTTLKLGLSLGDLYKHLLTNINRTDRPATIILEPDESIPDFDLLYLGKLFILLTYLNEEIGTDFKLDFRSCKMSHQQRLSDLGLPEVFEQKGIKFIIDYQKQLNLLPIYDSILRKSFSYPLLPLRLLKVPHSIHIDELLTNSERLVNSLAQIIDRQIKQFDLSYSAIEPEVSILVFRILKEIIYNAVLHSGTKEILVGVTISRETQGANRPHRKNLTEQPKFDVLVLDNGCGVFPSVTEKLSAPARGGEKEFYSRSSWAPPMQSIKFAEESLLRNLMNGELIIRNGRRSQGLHELYRILRWFQGSMVIRSGRTEMNVLTAAGKTPSVAIERHSLNQLYIPGVVVALLLPSRGLADLAQSRLAVPPAGVQFPPPARMNRLPDIPAGLFGGGDRSRMRRKAERQANELINSASRWLRQPSDLCELSLKASSAIDVDYFDMLLQEVCKLGAHANPPAISRLIFTNVPRIVINDLHLRSATSFLISTRMIVVMMDEADRIHLLGVPRVTHGLFDLPECLDLILRLRAVKESQLMKRLKIKNDDLVKELRAIISLPYNSMFSREERAGEIVYKCLNVVDALRAKRSESLREFSKYRITEWGEHVFRLRNGALVDRIIDFCQLWSDDDIVFDAAHLMLQDLPRFAWDMLISFMNNGDRLAAAIRHLTGMENILILDSGNVDSWRYAPLAASPLLVVDAIYPGDELGYLEDFIRRYNSDHKRSPIKQIWAFSNFTIASDRPIRRIGDAPIYALNLVRESEMPKEVVVGGGLPNILINHQGYVLSKPVSLFPRGEYPTRPANVTFRESELSGEFWHLVSEMNLLTCQPSQRDSHLLLFFDHTERILQHSQARQILEEFVCNFLREGIDLNVGVVLHPTHPVGAYLAQLVSLNLPRAPIIVPVTQRRYGGPVECTASDYRFAEKAIENRKREGTKQLSCLIIDDSVVTGGSLLAMMGVANRLGLEIVGIMTILNRLPEETSSAINSSVPKFECLFRLHISTAGEEGNPSRQLKQYNKIVTEGSSSHFVNTFVDHVRRGRLDFENLVAEGIACSMENPFGGLSALGDRFPSKRVDPLFDHVVRNLILHPDYKIIDFERRVAIACNFLDSFAYSSGFWMGLWRIFVELIQEDGASSTSHFFQAILELVTFSKNVLPYRGFRRLQLLCYRVVVKSLDEEHWISHAAVVAQCIASLGILGSEQIARLVLPTVTTLAPKALRRRSPSGDARTDLEAARLILSSLSWSLTIYIKKKGLSVFSSLRRSADWTNVSFLDDPEVSFALIDLLEPALSEDRDLCEQFAISSRPVAESLLSVLPLRDRSAAKRYMAEAPGYACTLYSLLTATGADSVFLYAKGYDDPQFYLRYLGGRYRLKSFEELPSEALESSWLPEWVRDRMDDNLFLFSADTEFLDKLNFLSEEVVHQWYLGGAVRTQSENSMRYYFLLGFTRYSPTPENRNTAFFYWLRLEAVLRQILPEIHRRYAESLASWNSLVQSIRPYHVSKGPDEDLRRRVLKRALLKFDFADIVQSTVRRSSSNPLTTTDCIDLIDKSIKQFLEFVESVARDEASVEPGRVGDKSFGGDALSDAFPGLLEGEIAHLRSSASWEYPGYFAIPRELITLIVIETACNALSYYKKTIEWSLDIYPCDDDDGCANVRFRLLNDVDETKVESSASRNGRGLGACKTAIRAAGGEFEHKYIKADGGVQLWEVQACLRVFRVPTELEEKINAFLRC